MSKIFHSLEGNDCDDAYKVEHGEVGDSVAENVDGD